MFYYSAFFKRYFKLFCCHTYLFSGLFLLSYFLALLIFRLTSYNLFCTFSMLFACFFIFTVYFHLRQICICMWTSPPTSMTFGRNPEPTLIVQDSMLERERPSFYMRPCTSNTHLRKVRNSLSSFQLAWTFEPNPPTHPLFTTLASVLQQPGFFDRLSLPL